MGVKLEVWRQGQFYPELGKKVIELPYMVNPGPSDSQVCIEGFNVQPDRNGNFLDGNYSEEEQDAISTYGTVRQVIDLYEKLLGKTINWSWQNEGINEPLRIKISNYDINARYFREHKCIELDYYGPEKNLVYNCRSVDLVAHETGHAILDTLQPLWSKGIIETKGLAEAFCDITAMFIVLSQRDLCEIVIEETEGDLNRNSILSLFGVGYGYEEYEYKEIRSAINNEIYNMKAWNSYDYSQVIVGLLYELLLERYLELLGNCDNNVEALFDVGQQWMKVIFNCLMLCNSKYSNIRQFCEFLKPYFKAKSLDKFLKKRAIVVEI